MMKKLAKSWPKRPPKTLSGGWFTRFAFVGGRPDVTAAACRASFGPVLGQKFPTVQPLDWSYAHV